MASAYQLCGEKANQKNSVLYQYFCLGESCPSSSHSDARQFSSSLYVPGAFSAAVQGLQLRASASVSPRVGPCVGPFRGTPGAPEAFCLTDHNPCWFLQPGVMGNFHPGTASLD